MSDRLNPNISFLDKSYEEDLSSSYILLLQLSDDRLVYAIFNSRRNKFIGLGSEEIHIEEDKTLAFALEEIIHRTPILTSSYKKVFIAYNGLRNTLVPLALFDEAKLENYLRFNHTLTENSTIMYDKLKNTPAANIYSIPCDLEKTLTKIWPDVKLFHFSTVLIESLGINFKHLTNNKMVFVNLRGDSFDIIYYKQSKLEFYNLFRYKTKEDFIYFLLAAVEQLGLNPESVELILSGAIEKDYQLYDMIFRYIRHSAFIEINNTFEYAHVLDDVKHHQYYGLYNMLQCES